MNQSQNSAACKTDVLKAEPDIQQHADRGYDHGYDGILSHLRADGRGNALSLDQAFIHIKILHQSIVQRFSLVKA